ncbi:carboxypeptidase-like regulatory domain-containing protein [Dactylosporangium sp. NBC_01737]|uniref:carboxypeptidase-like regulatory domain-containing protein n=1 Tax=Dactylosporangium sp. NBC_01737 TaxID=2975959 RepID=UPI002E0D3E85|nr:carboxypeptidase-like regulatory domain-containing protein [Dactylosporangium sp. NBC_01737]
MRSNVLGRTVSFATVTATTLATTAVAVALAAPAYAAGTGTITGHLTDASGNPAANAYVWTQQPDMSANASAYTGADGAYTLPDLPEGDYVVSFRAAGGSFVQWARQKVTFSAADRITVGAGATVVVDDQLLPTGTIQGRLLNRDGTPAQAFVTVYQADVQSPVNYTTVQADGTFSTELPAGTYKLGFRIRGAFEQWSGGQQSYETAKPVVVTAGQAVQVDETVLPTGSLGGRLTRTDGTPAGNVQVITSQPGVNGTFASVTTDADGRYRFNDLLLGNYEVAFYGPNWVAQYAHGKLDPAAADRFAVTDGQLTTVDEVFLPTGTIRVIAHDAVTGAPLSDFCAYTRSATTIGGCATGTELLVTDVFVGSYPLDVSIDDHLHLSATAGPAVVVAGQTVTVDVALRRGATITTTMVARAGGAAADGCVSVARLNDAYSWTPYGYCSDWTPGPTPGSVVVGPLEPGTYQLFADPRGDALGMQWLGATGGTGSREAARQFTLAAGDQITAPVIRFDKAGTVKGTVTDAATGAPVPYTCVWVAALSSGFNGSGDCPASTATDGTYSIPGVGPYAWPVEFAHYQYQWRWSGNAANRRTATPVTVQAGRKATANIKLRTGGGTLTGIIRDASGHPIDAFVVAHDAVTGEAVQFAGGITPEGQPPATYTIATIAPQQVKISYRTDDGRTGWLGGADLAHATAYDVRNNRTLTVNIVIP